LNGSPVDRVPDLRIRRPEVKTRKHDKMEKVFKKKFDKVLTNPDDDGERLISAANRFLEMATKEAVLLEENPN
jgi:hypothetical protein